MIETERFERLAIEKNLARRALEDGADAGEQQILEQGGHAGAGANGKEKLVFLASVQRLFSDAPGKRGGAEMRAATPEARQMRARSSDNPSLRSIAAVAWSFSRRYWPRARRG